MSNLISEETLNASYDVGAHWINKLFRLGIVVEVKERSGYLIEPGDYDYNSEYSVEPEHAQTSELIEFAESSFQFDYTSIEILTGTSQDWVSWLQSCEETIMQIMESYLGYRAIGILSDPTFCIRVSSIFCRDRLGGIEPLYIIYWVKYPDPSTSVNPRCGGEEIGWTLLLSPPGTLIGEEIKDSFQTDWNADVWLQNPLRQERNGKVNGTQPGTEYPDESGYSTTSFFG